MSGKDISVEFAELLGLSRVGVTTHISAGGGSVQERDQMRKRWTLRRSQKSVKDLVVQKNESQTELNGIASQPESLIRDRDVSRGPVNWTEGIKTTTVITTEVS